MGNSRERRPFSPYLPAGGLYEISPGISKGLMYAVQGIVYPSHQAVDQGSSVHLLTLFSRCVICVVGRFLGGILKE